MLLVLPLSVLPQVIRITTTSNVSNVKSITVVIITTIKQVVTPMCVSY